MVADVYGRKSTDDKGKSVNDQLDEAQEAIEEHDWTLGRVFVDDNRSASRFAKKKREDFAALLEHIESGRCELLILWESSRGSRKLSEWAAFLDLIQEHGILIYVVSHRRTYDCRINRDWETLATDGVRAHAESNQISERVTRGKRRSAKAGRPAGKLMFGFRRVYNDAGEYVEQVEHPEQAALVREAAQRVLAGEACHSIAVDFNTRGILSPRAEALLTKARRNRDQADQAATPNAKRAKLMAEAETWEAQAAELRWDLTQVKRLCVMPAYAGLRQHQGKVIGPAGWEGIHDRETYAKLVARLTDPKRRTQRDSALKHMLSGLIRCGLCESDMRVLKNRGYPCYTCKGCMKISVRTVSVEAFVEEMCLARLERSDAATLFTRPENDNQAAAAEQELKELNKELEQWRALAKARKVSPASFAEFEADLLPQIEAAEVRAKRAKVAPVPERIQKLAEAPRERWPELTVYQCREAIGLLVAELKVGPVGRGKRVFDPRRLGESRWVNDPRTWGEHWAEQHPAVVPEK